MNFVVNQIKHIFWYWLARRSSVCGLHVLAVFLVSYQLSIMAAVWARHVPPFLITVVYSFCPKAHRQASLAPCLHLAYSESPL